MQDGFSLTIPLLNKQEEAALLKGKLAVSDLEEKSDHTNEIIVFKPSHHTSEEITIQDKHINFYFDIITPSFLLLSRKEETLTGKRDFHGRFRYYDSIVFHYGLIDVPLVDEYAMLLRQKLLEAGFPAHKLQKRQGQLIPTHDIDHLMRFHSRWQAYKSIFGRDLLINHKPRVVKESLREYREWKQNSCHDPYITAIADLLELEKELPSIFFFQSMTSEDAGMAYDIRQKEAAAAWKMVVDAGKTVGIHGSYPSFDKPERLLQETWRLRELSGQPITYGRQHYLRFEAGADNRTPTLTAWVESGITDDFTLGFAEYAGFRCGTCHPYPLYDLVKDQTSYCIEHPLILMDGTLFDYMRLTYLDCQKLIQKLYRQCMDVEGDFVILWHNHLLRRNYYPLYKKLYVPLIQEHISNNK